MKENGKKGYSFRLEFSSGDVWETETVVKERTEYSLNSFKYNHVKNRIDLDLQLIFYFIKVEDKFLVGMNSISFEASHFNMINGQSGKINGRIELQGIYKRKMREYLVEDGDFKFKFYGALYNLPDTIYTGKWTLKRK